MLTSQREAQLSTGWRLHHTYMLGVANQQAHREVPLIIDFAERTRVANAVVALLPILIDDTFDHEVYNESTGTRAMLIVDVLRLNPVLDLLNRACLRLKRRWSAQMIANANGDI